MTERGVIVARCAVLACGLAALATPILHFQAGAGFGSPPARTPSTDPLFAFLAFESVLAVLFASALELVLAGRTASRRGALAWSVAAALIAPLVTWGGYFQLVYASGVVIGGLEGGLERVAFVARFALPFRAESAHPARLLSLFTIVSAPAGPVLFSQLRALRLRHAMAVVAYGAILVVVPAVFSLIRGPREGLLCGVGMRFSFSGALAIQGLGDLVIWRSWILMLAWAAAPVVVAAIDRAILATRRSKATGEATESHEPS